MEETIFVKWNIVFCAEFKALLFDKKKLTFFIEKYSKYEWYNLFCATGYILKSYLNTTREER